MPGTPARASITVEDRSEDSVAMTLIALCIATVELLGVDDVRVYRYKYHMSGSLSKSNLSNHKPLRLIMDFVPNAGTRSGRVVALMGRSTQE